MNTPDLSQDRELAELAKELREAVRSTFRRDEVPTWEAMSREWQEEYLVMADAARTHLGTGYTLPEANEANAERLAESHWAMRRNPSPLDAWDAEEWKRYALGYLRALHAAFAPPDKPAPDYTTTDDVAEALRKEEQTTPALYVALASNAKLMEVLLNCRNDQERIKAIRCWAHIFEEASCKS